MTVHETTTNENYPQDGSVGFKTFAAEPFDLRQRFVEAKVAVVKIDRLEISGDQILLDGQPLRYVTKLTLQNDWNSGDGLWRLAAETILYPAETKVEGA